MSKRQRERQTNSSMFSTSVPCESSHKCGVVTLVHFVGISLWEKRKQLNELSEERMQIINTRCDICNGKINNPTCASHKLV